MRVKEQLQKEQERAFEQELSFAEWLDYYSKEPTSKELDDMQKELKTKKLFYRLQPSNNTHYFPLQGA